MSYSCLTLYEVPGSPAEAAAPAQVSPELSSPSAPAPSDGAENTEKEYKFKKKKQICNISSFYASKALNFPSFIVYHISFADDYQSCYQMIHLFLTKKQRSTQHPCSVRVSF